MAERASIRACLQRCILQLCRELSEELSEGILRDKKKRVWIRKWLSRREALGASSTLLKELATEDQKEYRNCIRMSTDQFNTLLIKISPLISKNDTVMRAAIPARVKLEITLSYLATGNSYRTLQRLFRVSTSAISLFVPDVCGALYEILKEYIKVSIYK